MNAIEVLNMEIVNRIISANANENQIFGAVKKGAAN